MISHLFVYGTLMRRFGHPMHDALARGADFVGEAVVQGRLYDLGHYPGLVLSESRADTVFGELYRLHDDDVLRVLDDYEGCAPGEPEPTEYVRRSVSVAGADGGVIEAWTYVYNRPGEEQARIASGRYGER